MFFESERGPIAFLAKFRAADIGIETQHLRDFPIGRFNTFIYNLLI